MVEAMKQWLEALESYHGYMEPLTTVFGGPRVPAEQSTTGKVERAITSLRQAVADLEKQEPVAWGNLANWCLDSDRVLITDKEAAEKYHRDVYDLTPLYPHPQPKADHFPDATKMIEPKREPLTEWKPIQTAPKDMEVLLYCNKFIPLYVGKKRYGGLGEPQQDEFEWRCSSSGRFANPTYWMPLPKPPIEAAHGIKERT